MKRLFRAMVVSVTAGLPATTAVADLSTIQFVYNHPEDGNVVALIWDQTTAGQVNVLVDGQLIGTATGAAGTNIAGVRQVSPGIHTFEVFQGNTSLGGLSQEVVPSQPTTTIDVECRQSNSPDDCEIVVTGTSQGPPVSRVDFFVDGEFAGSRVEDVFDDGFHVDVTFPIGVAGPHEAVVQWTIERDDPDSNYDLLGSFVSSGSTTCVTTCPIVRTERYTPGVCNGSGSTPDLSSPIFGLNYLFSSGMTPPCLQACDANGDGEVNVSDMVYVLNFLFSGGAAPKAWTDRNGDAVPDPACVVAAAGEDCAESHAACPP